MNAGGTSAAGVGGGAAANGGSGNSNAAAGGGASTAGGNAAVGGDSGSVANTSVGGASMSTTGGTPGSGNVGGSMPTTDYVGFMPVPNSQNAGNFNVGTWYASWKSKFYQDCGNGQSRIASAVGSAETFSEGIGYGMLLAVGNDDRDALDKLWAYYKAHVDSNGLMNWKIDACTTTVWGQNAAADGDEDAAMALVQADAKWGGYKTEATNLINAIKNHETVAGSPSYLLPGDAVGGWAAGTVNPSYFAIGYWHVWASYVNDPFWNQLASDAYTMLASFQSLTISNSTGALVPDWGMSSGQNPNNSGYSYDACRTPWRVAVDYAWFGTSAAQTFLQNVSSYVDNHGGVAGVPFDKNSAFLGAFALSGMAVSQAKADAYLNAWLSAQMDDTPYFQGSLRGVYLLLANHNFPRGI
jgi:endo-1,4-beta-D-glucanase Y